MQWVFVHTCLSNENTLFAFKHEIDRRCNLNTKRSQITNANQANSVNLKYTALNNRSERMNCKQKRKCIKMYLSKELTSFECQTVLVCDVNTRLRSSHLTEFSRVICIAVTKHLSMLSKFAVNKESAYPVMNRKAHTQLICCFVLHLKENNATPHCDVA